MIGRVPVQKSGLGVAFSLQHMSEFGQVEALALQAEKFGFESIWVPEAWGRDAFTALAVLASRTTTIKLGTGIVNVFSRTPAIVAQSIASLDDISGGRAILGLGASGPRVIEQWHGLKFEHVLQRTREFVEVVRLIVSGSPVNYEGQVYKLREFTLGFKPPRPAIPIYLAAIGPANVRLAGELADGWLPIFASRTLLESGAAWLTEGAERTGRSRSEVDVASFIPTLVGPRAPQLLRRHIAFYVAAMGSFYHRLMVRSGWAMQADQIRERWHAGGRREAAGLVSDEMLDALTITGDAATSRRRLEDFMRLGVDSPILAMPQGADAKSIHATLEALGG
jgi:F420-dependent oxidoreductase-like protein